MLRIVTDLRIDTGDLESYMVCFWPTAADHRYPSTASSNYTTRGRTAAQHAAAVNATGGVVSKDDSVWARFMISDILVCTVSAIVQFRQV